MEGTVSLAGAMHTKSNGILWPAQKRAELLPILLNYLDGRPRTSGPFNPKAFGTCMVQGCNVRLAWRCEFHSEPFMCNGQK